MKTSLGIDTRIALKEDAVFQSHLEAVREDRRQRALKAYNEHKASPAKKDKRKKGQKSKRRNRGK